MALQSLHAFVAALFVPLCLVSIAFPQRVPAEFEPQQATLLKWFDQDMLPGYSVDSVHLATVHHLVSAGNQVQIITSGKAQEAWIISMLSAQALPMDQIRFLRQPGLQGLDNYPRDYAPEWIYQNGKLGAIHNPWTYYGYFNRRNSTHRFLNQQLEQCQRKISQNLGLKAITHTQIVGEGGAKEFNGQGILAVVEATELSRNPNFTKAELEAAYRTSFHLQHVLWLPVSTVEDEHVFANYLPANNGQASVLRSASANGHIDEFFRFAAPDVIVLAEVSEAEAASSEIHRCNRAVLHRAEAAIQAFAQRTGINFRIIRVPMPEPIYLSAAPSSFLAQGLQEMTKLLQLQTMLDGSHLPDFGQPLNIIPAMSYCNFTIANGVVIGAEYWRPGLPEIIHQKDVQAREALQRAFPDRRIVTVNPLAINLGGGGLHCNTRHVPQHTSPLPH